MAKKEAQLEARVREIFDALPPLSETATPELRRVIERAQVDARTRGDPGLALAHLFRAMLEESTAVEILRGAGADVEALAREISAFMDGGSAVGVRTPGSLMACEWVVNVARLTAHNARREVTVGHVIAMAFRTPRAFAITVLERQGVTQLDVLRYVAHGIPKSNRPARLPAARLVRAAPGASGTAGRYQVVMHNDDFTSVEFVVKLLSGLFGTSRQEAMAVAKDIHERGSGVIAEADLKVALAKISKAERRAAKAGFPLKLTLRPAA